jgi:3-hydroxybutyryl-CoA dehydratase
VDDWLERYPVGRRAEVRHTFRMADVQAYAALTGDMNPLHVDPAAAARGRFGRPVVHGMLTASLFSRLLAMDVPGPGTIYLRQSLRFARPVWPDEEVTASVAILRRSPRRRLIWLRTVCADQDGRALVEGEALVLKEDDG